MNSLISVIIPVYNVAPYLRRCLDSVLIQSYHNLEIIIIDDGSTDESPIICDEYKQKDDRVIVVHQNNSGLSVARNVGLDICSGEWVAFLDSDDWINPEMYKTLLNNAINSNADISMCKSIDCPGGTIPKFSQKCTQIVEMTYLESLVSLLNQYPTRFEVWNKLWRRSLIGNVRFIEGQVCEDVHFDRLVFAKTKKFVFTNEVLHYYLTMRAGNTLSRFRPEKFCVFEEFELWREDLKDVSKYHADIISCIATDFAISIYLHAQQTNQPVDMLHKAKDAFFNFYKRAWRSKSGNKKSIILFLLSPKLYGYLLDIKVHK